ncbi:MAG: 3-deoxy-7-phosphoheptulonate synthase [Polyangiaceae bacterium]|nr:3-deoxy-7-phosphoheptulonate synthase [Polyangiaceae bacterium]
MIVVLRPEAEPAGVERALVERGLWVRRLRGASQTQLEVAPHSAAVDPREIASIAGVADVLSVELGLPRVTGLPARLTLRGQAIARGQAPWVIAGPCSVESEAHIHRLAEWLAGRGVRWLRGGAFKPRTSPYAFAGHGTEALAWLADAGRAHGLGIVTEAMSPEQAELVAAHADVLQIGSRNMQNFPLLRAAGATRKPVLLKRGLASTVEEWLLAAEHCLAHGAEAVVFCERGIRSFDPSTRNLVDLGAVALLAHVHELVVVVDPSHGAGRRDLIAPLSRAALAAGAAGVMLEVHDAPGHALSDGSQALPPSLAAPLLLELLGPEAAA